MLSDPLHWKTRNRVLTTSDVQVTYTLYASFNFLLVSRAFGNPNLTSESWHYRETVASVCRHMSFSLFDSPCLASCKSYRAQDRQLDTSHIMNN